MSARPTCRSPRRSLLRPPRRHRIAERGAGLLEVMIALAILMFAAFATSDAQVVALTGARMAGVHFALDRFSEEMVETLRAHPVNALDDEFDHTVDGAPTAGTPGGTLAADWRARVAAAIPGAGTEITCDDGFCRLLIVWKEELDGELKLQRFRTGTPL